MWKSGKVVLEFLGHVSTVAWLAGLAGGSATAARAVSVMPGGWLQNPFVPAAWFFSTLAGVVLAGRAVEWGWKRTHPVTLTVSLHGGEDAAIAISPSESGDFYGTGWLLPSEEIQNIRRERPFTLVWAHYAGQYRRVRGRDKSTLLISTLRERGTTLELRVHGDEGVIRTWDVSKARRQHRSRDDDGRFFEDDLPWLALRLEVRAKQFPNVWTFDYRFRVNKNLKFEIEPTTPLAARTEEASH
ncbi:MAG: hypothetical protein FJW23_01000 [Acidimicrobiia bacterium]|nr:hypothetical protein [Acidimicrobiia bacterium]